jgi:hypothetical protein
VISAAIFMRKAIPGLFSYVAMGYIAVGYVDKGQNMGGHSLMIRMNIKRRKRVKEKKLRK